MRLRRLEATKEKRARLAEEQREIRAFRKAHGLCQRCGKAEALPGITLCQTCRLDHNQSRSGHVEHSAKWLRREREAGRL